MAAPEYELNLRDYWRIFRRRKVSIIGLTLLFGLLALGFAWLNRPAPLYQAVAVVRYDRSMTMSGFMVESMAASPGDAMASQAAQIRSFPVLARAAKALDLIPPDQDAEAIARNPHYTEIMADLRERVTATQEEKTNLLNIAALAPTPSQAAKIANEVSRAYREENRLLLNARIIEARRFIESQVGEVTAQVQRAEDALRDQKEKYGMASLPEATAIVINRSAGLQVEAEKLRLEAVEVSKQIETIKRSGAGPELLRYAGESGDLTVAKLNGMLIDYMIERENLLVATTPAHPAVKELDAKIKRVQRSIDERVQVLKTNVLQSLGAKLQILQARLGEVGGNLSRTQATEKTLPEIARQFSALQREAGINEALLSQLRSKLAEIQIKEREQIEEVKPVRPALVPSLPMNAPALGNKALAGLFIGLLVGLVLAFVLELLDTSIATLNDVEATLAVPVLGVIPQMDPKTGPEPLPVLEDEEGQPRANTSLASLLTPESGMAEAYKFVRTNLECVSLNKSVKTILLTSATAMEGKTTTAVNLAIAMAQAGKKTLLVEADLRRPFLHRVFGLPKTPGVSEVILANKSWKDCVRGLNDLLLGGMEIEKLLRLPNIDRLFVLPSGTPVPNPSEFLSSKAMGELLEELRLEYDYVIVDCPPILPVTDASILASRVDGCILVHKVGRVSRVTLKRAKDILEQVHGRVLGVVLTGLRPEAASGYDEASYYNYPYRAAGVRRVSKPRRGVWASITRVCNQPLW
jgi:capsular exopolysaccharide synthesis family protein